MLMLKKILFLLPAKHIPKTLFLLLLSFPAALMAQSVSGVVKDSSGQPLPGVTIQVRGTKVYTNTDNEGNFKINAPGSAVLVATFVGYAPATVAVGNQNFVTISMKQNESRLDEVVVTALGIRKESRKLGYAVSTVKGDELSVNRTPNVGNSLQGKVAGVVVSPPTTGAGGSSKIRIRGVSSFSTTNSPLIILNGVPMSNVDYSNVRGDASKSPRGNSFPDGGDGLSSINPDDIETMTILKGATAAALYGFRAKDGAIVITTKSGHIGKGIGVEFNSNFVADKAIDQTDFQYEYGQGEHGTRPQTLADAQSSGTWSFGDKIDGAPTITFYGQTSPYVAHKHPVREFYQPGYTWSNTIGLSGSSKDGGFRISASDMRNQSIMPNSGFKRQTLNFSLNYNFGSKLTAGLSGNYSHELNSNPPNVTAQFYNSNITVYNLANTISMDDMKKYRRDSLGNERAFSRFTTRQNPYWWAYDRFENISRDRLFGNFFLRYSILPWVYVQGRAGQDYYTRSHDYNVPTGTRFLGPSPVPYTYNGEYYQEVIQYRERNYDFIVDARKQFDKWGFDVLAGGNQLAQISTNNNVLADNFYIKGLYTVMNGVTKDPQYGYSEVRVNSLYGAAELNYDEYLYLNLTARNDWFSTLNPESNSYLYPSASASFVFSRFTKSLGWLNYGKLRVAYAEVGSGTDPYQSNLYYGLNANTLNGLVLGSITSGSTPNTTLRPLKVKEFEVGLETRMFNNRLNVDVAVYKKKTIDEILPIQISSSTGYTGAVVNLGQLQNQGIEWAVGGAVVKSSHFSWESSVNGSYNKSKVLQLAGGAKSVTIGSGEFDGQIAEIVGQPLATIQGSSYARTPDGQIINRDGVPIHGPLKQFGSALPTLVGGWLNTFTFHSLRLGILIDGRFGGKLFSQSNYNAYRIGLSKETLPGRAEGGVIGKGVMEDPATPGKYVPNTVKAEVESYYAAIRGNSNIEPFIYKSDFVKLRQITLSYDISKLFPAGSVIKGASAALVANNVAVIKKYVPNVDPEMIGSTSDRTVGLEGGAMPITRSVGVNLNLKF